MFTNTLIQTVDTIPIDILKKKQTELVKGLNPEQKAAVLHIGSPLMLIAGAGSGKTRVLTHKIAYLTQRGIPLNKILAITFTKKAANEMSERVEKLLSQKPLWISTFHSSCVKILRQDITMLGREYTRRFSIYDEDDSLKIIKNTLKKLNLNDKDADLARNIISGAKQEYRNNLYDHISQLPFPASRYAHAAVEYQKALETANALDYDDIIYLTVELFLSSPDIRKKWQQRFEAILIDEFQDTNPIQYLFIQLLAQHNRNIFCVGDEKQCIYSWRGSRPDQMLKFIKDFRAAEMKLEQNYRSTPAILKIANEVINKADATGKALKLFTTNNTEGEIAYNAHLEYTTENARVTEKIDTLTKKDGLRYSDIAILIRMNFLSRGFENALMSKNIPYQIVGGLAFYDRAEIKDMLAYLRLLINPKDTAAFERAHNIPPRGLGNKCLESVKSNYKSDWLQALHDTQLAIKQKKSAVKLLTSLTKNAAIADETPHTALMNLIAEINYFDYLERHYKEDSFERKANVSELANVLKNLETDGRTFSEFLEDSLLSSEQDKIGKDDSVKIMTLHAAKGLEYKAVFMPALEEEIFPSARAYDKAAALEEERRLFYVGVTRAKENLYLSSALVRMKFGKITAMQPSRYIDDIEKHLR